MIYKELLVHLLRVLVHEDLAARRLLAVDDFREVGVAERLRLALRDVAIPTYVERQGRVAHVQGPARQVCHDVAVGVRLLKQLLLAPFE